LLKSHRQVWDAKPAATPSSRRFDVVFEMSISKSLNFDSVDVVVVGAGLSGLQAALSAQKAGLKCVVLEARDRVGGKTLSQPLASGKGVVDLGAAWLNEVTQPKIYALAKKYGYETVVQPTKGDGILEDSRGTISRYGLDELPDVSYIV
jgi:monoamine oxidase